ncbi:MAG: serine/threonine-protein kinase [Planctomycetaceae bacterium]
MTDSVENDSVDPVEVEPTQDSDALIADLLQQLLEQARSGKEVDIRATCRIYPELELEIRELWATVMVAEDLASSPENFASSALASAPRDRGPTLGSLTQPRTVGDFELLAELGRGGMGIVYRAHQLSLNRPVAIKMILRGELASPADLARFRAEAEAVARLEHPHIVRVYDVGELDGQPYFSMQYVEGVTLAQKLMNGPLTPRDAANILAPICRAIAHAHRQGVLHRDLKPSNVLIDQEGRPYVTDFGLAKRVTPAEPSASIAPKGSSNREQNVPASISGLTQSGAILGTPGYMAPEQAVGFRGEVRPTTDVYSLGAILYAMLTGRAPFQSASPVDTVLMVLEQDPPPPRIINPKADVDLEMIALKALQKPADLRYESADAMAEDLEAFLAGEPVSARSSHFSQILSRAFRPTHHVNIMQNWGLLWMWHALVLLVLCVVTNFIQWQGVTSRIPYLLLWTVGLGTWAVIFWNLRRRSGPVTFVERQIAHVWAASMACSTLLFGVEALLGLAPLSLSPVLALLAGAVFVAKAGILSGEFYIPAVVLFATCVPMALFPTYGLTIFGIASALAFAIPGAKFYWQRQQQVQES